MDLKTLIILNFCGTTLALVLMFTYKKNTMNTPMFYLHTFALGAMAAAYGLYWMGWDGLKYLPKWFDSSVGNGLIVYGAMAEYLSVQTHVKDRSRRWIKNHFFLATGLILVASYYSVVDNFPMVRIILVTTVVATIWFLTGFMLLKAISKSKLQITIGIMFVLSAGMMGYRVIEALRFGDQYDLYTGSVGHVLTFLSLFVYMFISGFGMILLSKEKSDAQWLDTIQVDMLTKTYNRNYFYELAEDRLQRVAASNSSLCVVMTDLDAFKQINDVYGHIIGDKILACYANGLLEAKSPDVIVGRYGGDEFLLLFESRTLEEAKWMLNELSKKVNALKFEDIPLCSSMGLCYYTAKGDVVPTLDGLIHIADMALYESKRNGGACVSAALYPNS